MAVSQIEEKILGRLARQTAPSNALLSTSLYQVLGLSIMLSRRLVKARRRRGLDASRDSKSIQLHHHIIWLAREGLSITEVYVLPYCQNGEQGPECRVMAAKLRASFYHVFCLFHNLPPVSQLSSRSHDSGTPPSSVLTPTASNAQTRRSPGRSPKSGKENGSGRKRAGKAPLRDPIPSMTSDTSYITNPYANVPSQTPPPTGPPPPIPSETRRTPTRPPGLTPIDIPASQSAASFLLPPINFVPLARDHFNTAQQLASNLLSPAHALRLSVSLEHSAFLWDCAKEYDRARRHARRAIKDIYSSTDGLDDDEFADASALVQALGGIVRRGTNESTPQPSREQMQSPNQRVNRTPQIDRTIAVSPPRDRNQPEPPAPLRSILRTPERLSTVPEVESTEAMNEAPPQAALTPPVSRLSSRSGQRRTSSGSSDKASKRQAAEQAEELHKRRSGSSRSNNSPRSPNGHISTSEGRSIPLQDPTAAEESTQNLQPPLPGRDGDISSHELETRVAVLKALNIITAVSRGLAVPERGHGSLARQWRLV